MHSPVKFWLTEKILVLEDNYGRVVESGAESRGRLPTLEGTNPIDNMRATEALSGAENAILVESDAHIYHTFTQDKHDGLLRLFHQI